jgi:hypothetical protein
MTLKDTYRYLIGAYFGVQEMDEYVTKEYVLKDIEEYINSFLNDNPIDFSIEEEKKDVEDNVSLYVKLHDALIVLPKINAPLDLVLLVKDKIREMKKNM